LESQGLLLSQWREEQKRNKRFYRLSPVGSEILASLLGEWHAMNTAIGQIANHGAKQGQTARHNASNQNRDP
jgi:PadR family transcriptional regulator PadR